MYRTFKQPLLKTHPKRSDIHADLYVKIAISVHVNATSPSRIGTVGSSSTTPYSNASMCAVEHHGLAPLGDGPPMPEDYSTACSCSDLIRSFASTTLSPYMVMHNITEFETITTIENPKYLYVWNPAESHIYLIRPVPILRNVLETPPYDKSVFSCPTPSSYMATDFSFPQGPQRTAVRSVGSPQEMFKSSTGRSKRTRKI